MSPATKEKLSSKRGKIILAVLVIGLGVLGYILWHLGEESTDDAAIEAHVISLSPKVGGYIKKINVRDNQSVKAGEVLFEIDPEDYLIRRDRAQAGLDAATAAYHASTHTLETTQISAPSNLDAAVAQVEAAQANWTKARNDLGRMQRLSDEARSRQQLDEAIAVEKTTRSSFEDAKARLRSAQTAPKTIATAKFNTEQLSAQIKQAQADLAQAEKDLADTKIIAPMDGHITKRGVEMGDFLQPGQQIAYLVGNDMWVVANFKETQLSHIRPGQKVSIHIDAFSGADIEGKVDSVQAGSGARFSAFPPENATGNFVKVVQRVPVKILITTKQDAAVILGPGMSVVPTIYTR